jgi:hypothetical protein
MIIGMIKGACDFGLNAHPPATVSVRFDVHYRAGERPGDAADRVDAGDDQHPRGLGCC